MKTILGWFRLRPLRLLGGFLVFLSLGLLVFMVLFDIIVGFGNPYLGILVYMILPGILIFGLILVPLDSWLERRRAAQGKPPYPVLNLSDPRQRKMAVFFAISSVAVLVVMTVVTFKGVEYMDTKTFCGTTCHFLMTPEYTTYQHSPHANVPCVDCHIGPGATWYVRAKLSGLPQVYHYVLGDYPRPVPTPVKALRPSRDTCEVCHWPDRFYGNMLNTKITYGQDSDNTRQTSTMTMYIGSGGVPGSGIHSHIISKVYYRPAVENRTKIAWTRVERPDGSSQEFVNPSYKDDLKAISAREERRLMDCVDCHNRAAHDFQSYETHLDEAITRRLVDTSLPFIKKQAMLAVGDPEKLPTVAEQNQAISRIKAIPAYYQRELPDLYKTRRADIDRSVKGIQDAYIRTYYPRMKVGPNTYPDWRTHDGCFRCHGTLVAASPKGRDKMISADCNLCHSQSTTSQGSEVRK